MIEHNAQKPVWPIEGKCRRFVPVSDNVITDLEAFCRDTKELRRIHATLRSIADQDQQPMHPKLVKMHGANLYEFGDFGQRKQGRIYLYRTRVDERDTFLMCLFHRKQSDQVPKGLEEKITATAQAYLKTATKRSTVRGTK